MLASKREGNLAGVNSMQNIFGDAVDEDDDGFTDRVETENIASVAKLYWYDAFGFLDRIKMFGSVLNEFSKGGQIGNEISHRHGTIRLLRQQNISIQQDMRGAQV